VPEPPYALRRSGRARRARLTLTAEGEALVVLPADADESVAGALVQRHHRWLERHRSRILAERRALASRPALDAGRLVQLGGVGHRIKIDRRATLARPSVVVHPDEPVLVVRLPGDKGHDLPAVLERWLRREARRVLSQAVAARSTEMGLRADRVSVRDQRTRWASASPTGTLSFSWRLVMCPPEVLDYVVVHELAHLRWRGHGPRFWSLVFRHVPDTDRHRRWLREQRGELLRALD